MDDIEKEYNSVAEAFAAAIRQTLAKSPGNGVRITLSPEDAANLADDVDGLVAKNRALREAAGAFVNGLRETLSTNTLHLCREAYDDDGCEKIPRFEVVEEDADLCDHCRAVTRSKPDEVWEMPHATPLRVLLALLDEEPER